MLLTEAMFHNDLFVLVLILAEVELLAAAHRFLANVS
jgi:hypothetical protein